MINTGKNEREEMDNKYINFNSYRLIELCRLQQNEEKFEVKLEITKKEREEINNK